MRGLGGTADGPVHQALGSGKLPTALRVCFRALVSPDQTFTQGSTSQRQGLFFNISKIKETKIDAPSKSTE